MGSIPPHRSRNVSLSISAPWRTIVPPVDHQAPPITRVIFIATFWPGLPIGVIDIIKTDVASGAQRVEGGGHTFGGAYRHKLETSKSPPAVASPTKVANSSSP